MGRKRADAGGSAVRNIDADFSLRPRDAAAIRDEELATGALARHVTQNGLGREVFLDLVEALGLEEQIPAEHRRPRRKLKRVNGNTRVVTP